MLFLAVQNSSIGDLVTDNRQEPLGTDRYRQGTTYNHQEPTDNHQEPSDNLKEPPDNRQEPGLLPLIYKERP